jgi:hypothetical protein
MAGPTSPRSQATPLALVLAAAALACQAPAGAEPGSRVAVEPGKAEPASPTAREAWVQAWAEPVHASLREAFRSGRGGGPGEVDWTEAERARLEGLRAQARTAIAEADPDQRPWLLLGYARSFQWFGLGTESIDALLALPPEHPAWADLGSLIDLTWEASESTAAEVEAHVHALAAHQLDNPYLQTESLYLHLREADRARDWDRAAELDAAIEALGVADQGSWPIDEHRPDRMLRAETPVPNFCAPALPASPSPAASADELEPMCLDALFPHAVPTLILGSSSWCGACRVVVPVAVASARAQGVRGVLISYDESPEQARAYRAEVGIEDWPVLLPRLDGRMPEVPGDLALRPIPFLALVDERGQVSVGTPWLDPETLTER